VQTTFTNGSAGIALPWLQIGKVICIPIRIKRILRIDNRKNKNERSEFLDERSSSLKRNNKNKPYLINEQLRV
jgi:hypothetical protein